ncbi:M24 family metallopeptidase, partial [archaeon]
LIILPLSTTGKDHRDKIAEVRTKIQESQGVGMVVTMLDEVAWLCNLRGGDIPYNPVFFAFAVVTLDKVVLCIDVKKVSEEVKAHLGGEVEVRAYEDIESTLQSLATQGKILVDPGRTSWRLYKAIGSAALDQVSSIQLSKSVKNDAELNGMRACHVRDGVALTAFLHWLETTIAASPHSLTECQATDKLEEFRGKMAGHVGPSFSTIAGFGPNGAIIHYKPEPSTCATIGTDSIFLLDSGGQYLDGTTDVTRTMHFGTPTEHMKKCYTSVLKVREYMICVFAIFAPIFPVEILGLVY